MREHAAVLYIDVHL